MLAGGRAIRVLVVDDSPLVREMICAILTSEPDISVVGEAVDGLDAVRKVPALKPDLVTMDIEMPVMGGLAAIEKIMAEHPVPILVVTALTGVRTAFDAVAKGALDVIEKPDVGPENMKKLIGKVRLLSRVDVSSRLTAAGRRPVPATLERVNISSGSKVAAVAIAASTGGPQAIFAILSSLPATFAAPIVLAQHIAEGFTQGMVDWLAGATPLKVSVAKNGESLEPGRVYINPAEHSMRIVEGGRILLGERDPRRHYRPCCDTMLLSVAAVCRERAVGLILSGMGNDGVAGMEAIRKNGGATLAQDAQSSVVYGMNRCAVERGCIDKILPLAAIPAELALRVGKISDGGRRCAS